VVTVVATISCQWQKHQPLGKKGNNQLVVTEKATATSGDNSSKDQLPLTNTATVGGKNGNNQPAATETATSGDNSSNDQLPVAKASIVGGKMATINWQQLKQQQQPVVTVAGTISCQLLEKKVATINWQQQE